MSAQGHHLVPFCQFHIHSFPSPTNLAIRIPNYKYPDRLSLCPRFDTVFLFQLFHRTHPKAMRNARHRHALTGSSDSTLKTSPVLQHLPDLDACAFLSNSYSAITHYDLGRCPGSMLIDHKIVFTVQDRQRDGLRIGALRALVSLQHLTATQSGP